MASTVKSASDGVLLTLQGCRDDGEHVRARWKCFAAAVDAQNLKWEIRWFAKDCGYDDTGKRWLSQIISDCFKSWSATLAEVLRKIT